METGDAKRKGFTLVELMVVISIISILTAMLLYGVNIAMDSVKRGDTRAMCAQVRDAINMYYTDNKVNPIDNNLATFIGMPAGSWVHQLQRLGKRPPYILGLDDTHLTLTTNSGEIIDHFDSALNFRVVGLITGAGNEAITSYYKNTNALKTFYVWSMGPDQIDAFTSAYAALPLNENWDTLSTSFATFKKIENLEMWADLQGIDDIISN